MSVDTVNYALTSVTQRIRTNPNNFSEEGLHKLLMISECMRANLMAEDVKAFNDFVLSQALVPPKVLRKAVMEEFVPVHGSFLSRS